MKSRLPFLGEPQQLHYDAARSSRVPNEPSTLEEVTAYLVGTKTEQQMIDDLRNGIRRLAKRQRTWFRGLSRRGIDVTWIGADDHEQRWGRAAALVQIRDSLALARELDLVDGEPAGRGVLVHGHGLSAPRRAFRAIGLGNAGHPLDADRSRRDARRLPGTLGRRPHLQLY